jgi:lipopolysaccharide heptosyltransferase II
LKKILVIQTAFIGDAILATGIIEKLHQYYTETEIHFLVRKGNESLFENHPFLRQVLVWDKSKKYSDLWRLLQAIRKEKFDVAINLQRFGATGLLTGFSGATKTIGFEKNPFFFLFSESYPHEIQNSKHEVERNHELIKNITDNHFEKPKLYPSEKDINLISKYTENPFVCIAPASVWFTKQLPEEKWVELINKTNSAYTIFILGSKADNDLAQRIIDAAPNKNVVNLCGKISLLQSAVLMKLATMNYVNDSAPLHLASSVNAPVTAFFCSTIPEFGFGPLSENSQVIQTEEKLICRPCGLHGKKACPEGHFKCGKSINISSVPNT